MARLLPAIKRQFLDANGGLLAGGKIYSYIAGTSTPLATYTDQTEDTENSNPVILDANGEAPIWVGDAYYKFVITDANDVTLDTVDSVSVANDVSAEAAASAVAAAASAAAAAISETNAAASAASASASAATATTQASNASSSASSASTSASTATTQASNASSSASSASTSASTATTQATNASNSATAAGTSATNANNSAIAAAASAAAVTGLSVYANDAAFVSANGTAQNGDMYYNSTLNQARLYAGGWGSVGGGGLTVVAVQTIAAAGAITNSVSVQREMLHVKGTTTPTTASTTPFGTAGTWVDGSEKVLVGNDDDATLIINANDAANGCVGNFSAIELNKYKTATFIWSASLSRWIFAAGVQ